MPNTWPRATVTTVRRNSFSRTSLVRECVSPADVECAWCGSPARFCYGTETDGGTRHIDYGHAFCCIDCYRSYHNLEKGGEL